MVRRRKNRLTTDAVREVKNTFSRFLSILILSALAVAFLAGLRAAAPDMQYTADRYFDRTRFMDAYVISTLGLTDEDLQALADAAGVETVEGIWSVDAIAQDAIVSVRSMPQQLNLLDVREGRLPEAANECVTERLLLIELGLEVGDQLNLVLDEDNEGDLKCLSYTIVGVVGSPLYVGADRGTSSLGNGSVDGFLYVPGENFDYDYYTMAYFTGEGLSALDSYGDEYDERLEALLDSLDGLAEERARLRYDKIVGDAQEEIDDARAELSDAQKELDDAKADADKELADARQELADARQELDDGWDDYYEGIDTYHQEIADAEQELADAHQELLDAEQELADGKKDYEDGLKEYQDGLAEYEDGKKELEDGRKEYEDGLAEYEENRKKLEDGRKEYEDGLAEYEENKKKLEDGRKEYEDGLKEYEDAVREYEEGLADYEEGKKKYEDGLKEYQDGLKEYEDGQRELEDARKELDKQWDNYYDGRDELDQGQKQLDEGWAAYEQNKVLLDENKAKLDQGRLAYEQGKALLDGKKTELENGWVQYEKGKAQLDDQQNQLTEMKGQLETGEAQYTGLQQLLDGLDPAAPDFDVKRAALEQQMAALREQLDVGQAALDTNQAKLDAGYAGLEASRQTLETGQAELDAGYAELETNRQLLETSQAQLDAGYAELAKGKAELDTNQSRLDAGYAEASEGRSQLEAAEKELSDGYDELADGKKELDDAKKELADAAKELEDGQKELEDGKAELDDAWQELEDARVELEDGEKELADGWQELEDARIELEDGEKELADGWQELEDARIELEDGEKELADAWQELEDGRIELEDAKKEIEDGEKELADGWQEYNDGVAELEDARVDGQQELDDALAELNDGEQEYADGLVEYADGEKEAEEEIADAQAKLDDAQIEVDDAQAELDDIDECEWYVLGRNTNVGFEGYGQDSERVSNLANIFPIIFFLVAALACLTTMTRMVEEQRTQIGALKAMGFSRLAISKKYIGYALTASLAGGVLGLALGATLIPEVIANAFNIMYNIPALQFKPQIVMYSLAVLAAVVCTTGAALWACLSTLVDTPANLMRPRAPKPGKRVLLEYIRPLWSRLSFTWKVTMRNLFRYKRRFWMTVIGIGGCTALIVTGFGLHDSIFAILNKQFDEISLYDATIGLDEDISEEELAAVENYLESNENVEKYMVSSQFMAEASTDGPAYDAYLFSVGDMETFTSFINLRHRLDDGTVTLPEDEVLITEKLSELLDVKAGDTITLEKDDERVQAVVADIVENYVRHYVYMSYGCYEKLFGEAPEENVAMIRYNGAADAEQSNQVSTDLMMMDGVTSYSYIATIRDSFTDSMIAIDYAVIIVIVAAAALAFVVLYNLTNINITERTRELATLKVLGFYDRETTAYVYRENIFLTIFGILLGLVMGRFLHAWLVLTVEVNLVMFGRTAPDYAYILAAVLTVVFSVIVNIAAHFKLKKVDMVESLKTVE